MKNPVKYYSVHAYLQTFDNLEDVPLLPEDKRAYDPDDEDGVDVNSDLRLDFLDKAEILGNCISEADFQPHVDPPSDNGVNDNSSQPTSE